MFGHRRNPNNGSDATGPVTIQDIVDVSQTMIRQLNEIASTRYHPSMFRVYNGSERHGRLRSLAKDMVEAANATLLETHTTRRCPEHLLAKIIKLLHTFGDEIRHFNPADGGYYITRLCEKCCQFLKEYSHNLTCTVRQIMDPSSGGLVSPRFIDSARILETAPVSTLQLATETWEVWAGQGKESIVEIQRISDGVIDEERIGLEEGEEGLLMQAKQATVVERSMAAKVFLLCRLVKTMVRKIRLRCIQPIFEPIESLDEILWLDELMETGEQLFPAIDELATAVIPAQVPSHVCTESVHVVRVAQKVCELGWQQAGQEEHQKWFVNCHAQLDSLLIPILESNPAR